MAKSKGYTDTTKWRGSTLYECTARACNFNTDDKATIEKHVAAEHRDGDSDVGE